MVYRQKSHQTSIFRSEGRLLLGHETHTEAPEVRHLREEVYNGVNDILHQKTVEDRMLLVHTLALRSPGVVEESWRFYALLSSFQIKYRQNDRCRLGVLERKMLLMQARVDERCSAEDLGPFPFDTNDHPARDGYRGLPEYIRAFQCLADQCLRVHDRYAAKLLEQRRSLVLSGKASHDAPAYQHLPEEAKPGTMNAAHGVYWGSAHQEPQYQDQYGQWHPVHTQGFHPVYPPPHDQLQRHPHFSSEPHSDAPQYLPSLASIPQRSKPGLPGAVLTPETSDRAPGENITHKPSGGSMGQEELSTGLGELSIDHEVSPRSNMDEFSCRGPRNNSSPPRGRSPPRGWNARVHREAGENH